MPPIAPASPCATIKPATILCLVLFCGFSTFSQGFKGGAHLGFGASQVSGDHRGGYNKLGLFGGLFTRLDVTEKSSWQFELNYIEKGSRDAKSYPLFYLKLRYVDITALYRYHYNEKLILLGGLSYGTRLGEAKFETLYLPPLPHFRERDISFIIGLSYPLADRSCVTFRMAEGLFPFPIRDHESGARRLLNWGMYNNVLVLSVDYVL